CQGTLRYVGLSPPRRTLAKSSVESLTWTGWIRHIFTKSRISVSVFQPRPSGHEKYGSDPEQPSKLHLVTRIKSENICKLNLQKYIHIQKEVA
uniref:Uncharacterized protein n=1 Tax=Chrysemys picta bellii TaxID=8478 RepID=A0A8C3P5E5_CHRPI